MKNDTTIQKNMRGIVLVEAIIAIGMLVLIVTGTLNLLLRSTSSTNHVIDQTIATYLAQDALEWIIAKYEYNRITGQPWLAGLNTSACGSTCGVDTHTTATAGSLINCGGGGCTLYRNTVGGYSHTVAGHTRTPYVRTIAIDSSLQSGDEALVTVTVSWRESNGTASVPLTLNLYAP